VELLLLLLLQGRICDLVGMALEDEFAVSGLDGRGVGSLVDAESLVVIGRGLVHGGVGRGLLLVGCGVWYLLYT
jgi:hypothetical protein